MAAPHMGLAVNPPAGHGGGRVAWAGRRGPCRTCRFFGGYSRSGAQAWCLRELPMKVLWMEPAQGCQAHAARERVAA
ncbi:hypothetical protein [Inhella sp.]|uniref:hypothetical protein n=1 Tax=Inhella sp. TaxID=1921806 RepID=UPI0035B353AD